MKSALARTSSVARVICLAVWAAVLLFCIGSYIANPQAFTAANIAEFLSRFQSEIWLVYLAMSVLRGFTLLPSTPLVIAGTILFPGQPFEVLAVSIIGILMSSSMIYFFSEFLGFAEFFERHKPDFTRRVHARLERPTGFIFVFLWAFFPLVPTDAVCYVAGTLKMTFWRFLTAVLLGELILCSFYIFFGGQLIGLWPR